MFVAVGLPGKIITIGRLCKSGKRGKNKLLLRMTCKLNSCSTVACTVARGVDFILRTLLIFFPCPRVSLTISSHHRSFPLASIPQTNRACLRNRPAALPFLPQQPPSHVPRDKEDTGERERKKDNLAQTARGEATRKHARLKCSQTPELIAHFTHSFSS